MNAYTVGHSVSAVIDSVLARVLIADRFSRPILSMDLITGETELLWNVLRGEPEQITLDRVLVQRKGRGDIAAIDILTGEARVVY